MASSTFNIVFFICSISAGYYCTYLWLRINKVYEFMVFVKDKIFASGNPERKMHLLYKLDGTKMLFSFKSLKLENYFTKEEIDLLLNY